MSATAIPQTQLNGTGTIPGEIPIRPAPNKRQDGRMNAITNPLHSNAYILHHAREGARRRCCASLRQQISELDATLRDLFKAFIHGSGVAGRAVGSVAYYSLAVPIGAACLTLGATCLTGHLFLKGLFLGGKGLFLGGKSLVYQVRASEQNRRQAIASAELQRVMTIVLTVVPAIFLVTSSSPLGVAISLSTLYLSYESIVIETNKIRMLESFWSRMSATFSYQSCFNQLYRGAPVNRALQRIFHR